MSLVSIVLLRYFGSNSVFFFSTVSFSNEDNHCQLYATLDFVKFIVSICEQTNDLSFTDKSAFWTSYFFFKKSRLKVGGAAYTRVRLIHESLRYCPGFTFWAFFQLFFFHVDNKTKIIYFSPGMETVKSLGEAAH